MGHTTMKTGVFPFDVRTKTTSDLIHPQRAFPKQRTLGHPRLKFTPTRPRFQAMYTGAALVEVRIEVTTMGHSSKRRRNAPDHSSQEWTSSTTSTGTILVAISLGAKVRAVRTRISSRRGSHARATARLGSVHLPKRCVMDTREKESPLACLQFEGRGSNTEEYVTWIPCVELLMIVALSLECYWLAESIRDTRIKMSPSGTDSWKRGKCKSTGTDLNWEGGGPHGPEWSEGALGSLFGETAVSFHGPYGL
ncbi:hypothetical protein CRG98_007334 [Punica granatum]|uniref:Uncharacterized protein n=1 Tax=Punica granatum TaxID=22663 RepID=A0A2I0KVA6_PUNGR|nr:hypothetical protein CRG98_007334 [Punica granatum]